MVPFIILFFFFIISLKKLNWFTNEVSQLTLYVKLCFLDINIYTKLNLNIKWCFSLKVLISEFNEKHQQMMLKISATAALLLSLYCFI